MAEPLTFQEAIFRLQRFWADEGCLVWQPVNSEVGAGTMNPATFLQVLGPQPWSVAYVEPSVRPDDSRYGDNPNRMQTHTQFQVILKPDTGEPVEQYLRSLEALGIDTQAQDVRLVEDNWESPALGAWGLGWEIWLNGLEITQFTYFQQAGGYTLDPVSVEITYGLERILMALQRRSHFKQIEYATGVSYGDLFGRSEYEMSVYYLEQADIATTRELFDGHEREAMALLDRELTLPAYRHLLAMSHLFNVLDSRGAVGLAERAGFFGRMRRLSRACAKSWLGEPDEAAQATEPPPQAGSPSSSPAQAATAEQPLVLEIGVEEMPPGDVEVATSTLARAVPQMLAEARLDHGEVRVRATPRRLVVFVDAVAARQSDLDEEVRGPRADVAFDADGNPTKAAIGFGRRHGLAPEDLLRVEHEGQQFVAAAVHQPGRPARDVLAESLPGLLEKIAFPRSMRWNASGVGFSRPIRWLLALLGGDVVPFEFAGLASGRTTRPMRGHHGEIHIDSAAEYEAKIAELGVTLDRAARREAIWESVTAMARAAGGEVPEEYRGSLLHEVADLVEAPTPISASFEERFRTLPAEVLRTVMVKHQRFFPIVRGGEVLPAFVSVANGPVDEAAVREGYEAVIRARYSDAEFFYKQDIGHEFGSFREGLQSLTFADQLGSMADKVDRLASLSGWLAREAGVPESQAGVVERAAPLAKNDLATQMVTEFSALAGVMGGYYAERAGESPEVAAAIRDHVRPATAGDRLPDGVPGALIGAADRLDSLVGLFAVGVKPTSAADPYALRRAAYGLVQILAHHDIDLDLERAVEAAAERQPVEVSPERRQEVLDFVWKRLEVWLRDAGFGHDVVAAAVGGRRASIAGKRRTAVELGELAGSEAFGTALAAYNRAARIARQAPATTEVDESLFESPAEEALWAAYREVAGDPTALDSVPRCVDALSRLAAPIDDLFDSVMVMAEDERVAANRLALLGHIAAFPTPLVDLTQLRTATAGTAGSPSGSTGVA